MEIYTGRSNTVAFYGEPGWSVSATWRKNDVEQGTLPVTTDNDKYLVTLPYLLDEAEISIEWTLNIPGSGTLEKVQKLEVHTPLLSIREVKELLEEEEVTDQQAAEIERSVRLIIQAHTGQTFGRYVGKIQVTGEGQGALRMPMRLISFSRINNSAEWGSSVNLRGGGWYLTSKLWGGPPSVKADFHGYNELSGPIVAPYSRGQMMTFNANSEYEIDGVWGWEQVPSQVKEAARILIRDYSSADSLYRDRFLTSMTAADWRIQFHDGAFYDTGNVKANQLLADFVLTKGWVVI